MPFEKLNDNNCEDIIVLFEVSGLIR